MDLQIIEDYRQAFRDLYLKDDKPEARKLFYSGMYLYPQQADFFRGYLAARDTSTFITHKQMKDLFSVRHTFGLLSMSIRQPVAFPALEYKTPFFGYRIRLTSRARVHAAEAIRLARVGAFNSANMALVETPDENHPLTKLALAVLNFESKRWVDAFVAGQALEKLPVYNPATDSPELVDGKPVIDRDLYFIGIFIKGVSLAHLGNNKNAIEHLNFVLKSNNIDLVAEAYRWLALIARQETRFKDAEELLERGIEINPTRSLISARDNVMEMYPITTPEAINNRTSYWDVNTQPAVEVLEEGETQRMHDLVKEAEAELDRQIGMESVKNSIRLMKEEILFNRQKKKRGINVTDTTKHLILAGPPGTGKTTIARIIAKLYAGYGVVQNPELIEASRADLIGADEGSTAEMTMEVIKKARGGVLFIDEAPDMIQDRHGQTDFRGQEAVSVLLQEMENHRDDLIVIIAGYDDQLNRFLATNPGLRSRFANKILFESYSPEEIADIAEGVARMDDSILEPRAKQAIIDEVSKINGTDPSGIKLLDKLGNGRFARNLIEQATRNRLERLRGYDYNRVPTGTLMTLTAEDVLSATRSIVNTVLF